MLSPIQKILPMGAHKTIEIAVLLGFPMGILERAFGGRGSAPDPVSASSSLENSTGDAHSGFGNSEKDMNFECTYFVFVLLDVALTTPLIISCYMHGTIICILI